MDFNTPLDELHVKDIFFNKKRVDRIFIGQPFLNMMISVN